MKEYIYLCSVGGRAALSYWLFNLRSAGCDVISFLQGEEGDVYGIFILAAEHARGEGVIEGLPLDEKLSFDADMKGVLAPDNRYMDGHGEWSNKMYVDGYFTGGRLPYFLLHPKAWLIIAAIVLFYVLSLFLTWI